jgi:hypothetical protein
VLPEDARFCHKCGQPQYEEDIARLSEQPEVVVSAPAPQVVDKPRASIGFRNKKAIRITLLVAGVSFIVFELFAAILPPLAFVVMFGSGFASARIYQNRTAENLTPSGGAALGAMSWLWLYIVGSIMAWISWFSDDGRKAMKAALSGRPEFAVFINDPQKYASLLIASLLFALVIGAISAAVGGIMAVRMQPRGGASR